MRWRDAMKNAKKVLFSLFVSILGLFLIFNSLSSQQTAGELFEKALYMEEAQGDLQKAIDLYQKILELFPENREVAAKAQLHIGLCYEKLGLKEAQKAYREVINNYPEFQREVAIAKERIAMLSKVMKKVSHKPTFKKIQIPFELADGVQLSPDGKKLTFSSRRYEGSIWVVPLPGKVSPDIVGESVKLTGEGEAWGWGHVWSADGKWIAYNYMKNEKDVFVDEIHVISSEGGEPKKIHVPVNRGGGFHLYQYCISLSPDGKLLAYASREEEESGKPKKSYIYTIPVEGGVAKRLTEARTWLPAFSPDGKMIAYVKAYGSKEGKSGWNIWVIPTAGGTPVQVSNLPGRAISPVWSPDGKMIAFLRDLKGDYTIKDIWIVPVSEKGKPAAPPTKIELPLETSLRLAGWTSYNKIGVLLRKPVHQAIYTVPSRGGKATQVTFAEGSCPSWSPDGERIFFLSEGISSVLSEGGKVSTLPIAGDFQDPAWYGPSVSPDGRRIVFAGRKKKEGAGANLWTIPIEGGKPTQITKSPGTDVFPSWSPDGKRIVFSRQEKKPDGNTYKTDLYIVSAEGGDVRQLTFTPDETEGGCKWSPAGKLIAYGSAPGIKIIPAEGGESKVVLELIQEGRSGGITWSPDGKDLAYIVNGKINAISLDDGEPREIKTGSDVKAFHLAWSPDGKKFAFAARMGGELEFWLMEDFLPLVKKGNQ